MYEDLCTFVQVAAAPADAWAASLSIQTYSGGQYSRETRMQVSLCRTEILVTRELLGDNRVAGVLGGPRAELVAERVPYESFVPAVLQSREGEELPPHSPKILLPFACLRAEYVRVWIIAKSKAARLQRLPETLRADVHELFLPRRLLPFGLDFNGIELLLFAVDGDERWLEVDVLQLNQHHLVPPYARVERHHQPKAHRIALCAHLVFLSVPDFALDDLAA